MPKTFYLRSKKQQIQIKNYLMSNNNENGGSNIETNENFNPNSPSLILKPSYGSQGHGIQIIKNYKYIDELQHKSSFVAQHYIDNPLLLDNCKFDFR